MAVPSHHSDSDAPDAGRARIFWHPTADRSLAIHLPLRLPDRPKYVSSIRRHGGKVADRFAKADIVVIDTETASMSDQARELFRSVHNLPTPLPCVGPNWVTDSVKASLVQNTSNPAYSPITQLDEMEQRIKRQREAQELSDRRMAQLMRTEASKNPSLGVMYQPVNRPGKQPYTVVDRYNALEELMITPHAFGGRKIAEVLTAKHGRHTPGSWVSWLRDNMARGVNLMAKLDEYKQTGVNPIKLPARLKIGENQYVGEAFNIPEGEPSTSGAAASPSSRKVAPRAQHDDADGFEGEDEDDPIVSSSGAPAGGTARRVQPPTHPPTNRSVLGYRPHGIVDRVDEMVEERRAAVQEEAMRRAAGVREESRPVDGWPDGVGASTATKISQELKDHLIDLLMDDIETIIDGFYNEAPVLAKHKHLRFIKHLSVKGEPPTGMDDQKKLLEVCTYVHEQEEGSMRTAEKLEPDASEERQKLLAEHIAKNLWAYMEAALVRLVLGEYADGENEDEPAVGGEQEDGIIVGGEQNGIGDLAAVPTAETSVVSLPAGAIPAEVQGMLDDALAAFEQDMSDDEDEEAAEEQDEIVSDNEAEAVQGEEDDSADVEAALGADADQRAQHHSAKAAMKERMEEGESLQEQGYDRASPSEEVQSHVQQREKRSSGGAGVAKTVPGSRTLAVESTPPPQASSHRETQHTRRSSQQQRQEQQQPQREASPPPIHSPPPIDEPPADFPIDDEQRQEQEAVAAAAAVPPIEPQAQPTQPSPRRSQTEVTMSKAQLSHAFMKKKFGDKVTLKELKDEAAAREQEEQEEANEEPSASASASASASRSNVVGVPPSRPVASTPPPRKRTKTPNAMDGSMGGGAEMPALPAVAAPASTKRNTPHAQAARTSAANAAAAGTPRIPSHQNIAFHDFSRDEDDHLVDPLENGDQAPPEDDDFEAQALARAEEEDERQARLVERHREKERQRGYDLGEEGEEEERYEEEEDEMQEIEARQAIRRRPHSGTSRLPTGPAPAHDLGGAMAMRRTPRGQSHLPPSARHPSREGSTNIIVPSSSRQAGRTGSGSGGGATGMRRVSSGGSRSGHEALPVSVQRRASASRSAYGDELQRSAGRERSYPPSHLGAVGGDTSRSRTGIDRDRDRDRSSRSSRPPHRPDASTSTSHNPNTTSVDLQLAKARYTTSLLLLAKDFGFAHTHQLQPFLAPFAGELKRARAKLERHFVGLASEYGVDRMTVVDFVREAGGNLREAERFLGVLERSVVRRKGGGVGLGVGEGASESSGEGEEVVGGSVLAPLMERGSGWEDEEGQEAEDEEDDLYEQPAPPQRRRSAGGVSRTSLPSATARASASSSSSRLAAASAAAPLKRPRTSLARDERDVYDDEEEDDEDEYDTRPQRQQPRVPQQQQQQQQQRQAQRLGRGGSRPTRGGDGVASTSRRRLA
ncbi:hypothetical protein BDZ90DRAFT_231253 [Jaminaea rosea]|uniref:BRCT domain-containing protein n=1 Tax=Jaminaea rosea TaxID=1569628 RepID=A0A316USJ0_9BASI|nr:hypothetical protein BDZ90DRAFT_231253 [Jaminaea rosea]PWN28257.1 hypothetical protein BDZ90DRAFT_231253 [Jaminaea rosea]